jgi:NADPH-dependent ferric siderophore reductase
VPEPQPTAGAVPLDDPFAQLTGALAGTRRMRLEVVSSELVTPHMQRLVLTGPELAGFGYQPGQDLMFMVAVDGNRPLRRRYTIRALDQASQQVTLDIVRHGDGPGELWVRTARPGDQIEAIGPRGKIFLAAGADWHLFAADESGLAAVAAMTAALPPGQRAIVLLEVPEPADQQDLASPAELGVSWLPRGAGVPAGDPAALAAALGGVQLPPGTGHCYLFGEAKVVLRLREVLADRGLAGGQVSAKAYWGRGRANAQHGEPARD